MKKIFSLLTAVVATLALMSCNNESDVINQDNTDKELKTISFVYNDTSYTSQYYEENDSTIKLVNEDTNELYQRLQSLPDLATALHGDTLLFFDNYQDFERKFGFDKPQLRTSSGSVHWSVRFYLDDHYAGDVEAYEGNGNFSKDIVKFNNRISSFKFSMTSTYYATCCLTIYDNGYCDKDIDHKKSFSIVGNNDYTYIADLEEIGRSNWGRTWGDKITSFK